MSDIVTRLWGNTGKYPGFENLNTEAAAEIERLRARVAELEAAAAHLACAWTAQHVINTDLDRRVVNMIMVWDRPRFEAAIAESARAANGGGE